MSNRITIKDLENLVCRINVKAGLEPLPAPNTIGRYELSQAYGGVRLEQVTTAGRGIRVISTGGYGTKRELYNQMTAYLAGMEATGGDNE